MSAKSLVRALAVARNETEAHGAIYDIMDRVDRLQKDKPAMVLRERAVQVILALMKRLPDSEMVQGGACLILGMLAAHVETNDKVFELGALDALVSAMQRMPDSLRVASSGANAFLNIVTGATKSNRPGEDHGDIRPVGEDAVLVLLVALKTHGHVDEDTMTFSCQALANLACEDGNRALLLRLGAIDYVRNAMLAQPHREVCQLSGVKVFRNLASDEHARPSLLGAADTALQAVRGHVTSERLLHVALAFFYSMHHRNGAVDVDICCQLVDKGLPQAAVLVLQTHIADERIVDRVTDIMFLIFNQWIRGKLSLQIRDTETIRLMTEALRRYPHNFSIALHAMTSLFLMSKTAESLATMREEGLPELVRRYQARHERENHSLLTLQFLKRLEHDLPPQMDAAIPSADDAAVPAKPSQEVADRRCGLPSCTADPAEVKMKACSGCRSIRYCSREHQKEHWRSHKADCRSQTVE